MIGSFSSQRDMTCICQESQSPTIGSSWLDTFAAVREKCPAIKELFVPDDIWSKFYNWHLWSDVEAYHESALLLALDRGYLNSITSPVHRHLLESGRINSRIRKQYINDLREKWMDYSDPPERHRKFRMFCGRIVELQCTEWLERQSWKISALEAFREGPDIEATDESSVLTAFEIKFIGQDDAEFSNVLKSFRGEPDYGGGSPSSAINYLLYRIYESAKQLKRSNATARIALVVIDGLTEHTFKIQLKDGWIDWKNPAFMDGYDPFIDTQDETLNDEQKRTLTNDQKRKILNVDLKSALESINDVWILERSNENQLVKIFQRGE